MAGSVTDSSVYLYEFHGYWYGVNEQKKREAQASSPSESGSESTMSTGKDDKEDGCNICYEGNQAAVEIQTEGGSLVNIEDLSPLSPCYHKFHPSCIQQWLNQLKQRYPDQKPDCPVCHEYVDLTHEGVPAIARVPIPLPEGDLPDLCLAADRYAAHTPKGTTVPARFVPALAMSALLRKAAMSKKEQ